MGNLFVMQTNSLFQSLIMQFSDCFHSKTASGNSQRRIFCAFLLLCELVKSVRHTKRCKVLACWSLLVCRFHSHGWKAGHFSGQKCAGARHFLASFRTLAISRWWFTCTISCVVRNKCTGISYILQMEEKLESSFSFRIFIRPINIWYCN